MNIETRSNTQNRKRIRQSNLNQSIPQVLPKLRRTELRKEKMSNPTQNNNSPFIDLSRTINQTNTAGSNQSVVHEEEITAEVRELVSDEVTIVQRSLEDKVREMVQSEMSEVRKSIEQLTKCVADLAKLTTSESNAVISNRRENGPSNLTCSDTSSQTGIGNNARLVPQDDTNMASGNRHLTLPLQNGNFIIQNPQNLELPKIRVDKLGISFDGNPAHTSIDDFVFRLEHLQRHYQIPWNEVLRDFHLLMTGSAREWYWLFIKTHGVIDWPGLRHALLSQYQITRSNFEVMRDLVERKQQNGETVDAYFQAMAQIRSRLIQPMPEYDLIKIIKRNIKESIGRIVYPIAVSSVEQLRVECNEAEKNFPRRDIRPVQAAMRQSKYVNEVYYDDNQYGEGNIEASQQLNKYEELCAINVNLQQRKQALICWNCKQPGHVYMDCTSLERNLFCYKCGRPNVITPRCPNCQSGNQPRSLASKGDPSSSENQTPKTN